MERTSGMGTRAPLSLKDTLEPPPRRRSRPPPQALLAAAMGTIAALLLAAGAGCATVHLDPVATVSAPSVRRAADKILFELGRDPRLEAFRRELRRQPDLVRLRLSRRHEGALKRARDVVALEVRRSPDGIVVYVGGWHEDAIGRQIEDGHLAEPVLAVRQAVDRAGRRLLARAPR
ncbi:MAG: hypothetical protein D6729_15970 [Deltaproteobacteria bacterium]|nr:MAG: hypothetical protein D6729_15970 [Deltaproteobacteria bacterium]